MTFGSCVNLTTMEMIPSLASWVLKSQNFVQLAKHTKAMLKSGLKVGLAKDYAPVLAMFAAYFVGFAFFRFPIFCALREDRAKPW